MELRTKEDISEAAELGGLPEIRTGKSTERRISGKHQVLLKGRRLERDISI